MPPIKGAPTSELGTGLASQVGLMSGGDAPYMDDFEYVPGLQFPESINLFKQMRNDSQIAALYAGCTLPIRNYTWHIVRNGASDQVVAELAADLNLPVAGEPRGNEGRRQKRFSFPNHLRHALLGTIFGFIFFEQVGEIVDGRWRLRKLGERLPSTIADINIKPDGGLASIRQNIAYQNPLIPVDRLVAYVWDKEGGNWAGRSMLRPLYKNWLIKDRLMRVDAINHERSGAGMPVIVAPEGATDVQIAQLQEISKAYVAGEHGGATLPYGSDLKLRGVEGSQPATLESIKYHDESMARGFLAMFMQLGQTETGSRALGESFVDFMSLGQQAVAGWFRDTFNEHVIEDWVDWNYGETEAAPKLEFVVDSDRQLAVADLVSLTAAGALTIDDELKSFIRSDYGLPEADPSSAVVQLPVQAKRNRRTIQAAVSSEVSLPDRPLRREPYNHEVLAKTDFKAMDLQWTDAVEDLVTTVSANNQKVIAEIKAAIIAADGDLTTIAEISVAGRSADDIAAAMSAAANKSADVMVMEAKAQGKTVKKPDLAAVNASLAERAVATDTILARSLSEAGARKAMTASGGSLSVSEVATLTSDYLAGLTDAFLRDKLGGLITTAQNAGRKEVMKELPPKSVIASELLDGNTCGPCTDVDGTEYGSVEEAEADYPTGGYVGCEGQDRCRGTLVAVYEDEEDASVS